jgi:hypothetical protein
MQLCDTVKMQGQQTFDLDIKHDMRKRISQTSAGKRTCLLRGADGHQRAQECGHLLRQLPPRRISGASFGIVQHETGAKQAPWRAWCNTVPFLLLAYINLPNVPNGHLIGLKVHHRTASRSWFIPTHVCLRVT